MGDAPLYLPHGYRDRTRTTTEGVARTGQISDKGTVTHVEHWDGSVDATVRPGTVTAQARPVPLRMSHPDGADPDPRHVAAIAAFEKAQRRLNTARRTDDPVFLRRAEAAMYAAQRRLEDVQ